MLCGGRGERLASVSSQPKALIEIGGRPFLTYSLQRLHRAGFRRVICLTGRGAEHFPAKLSAPELAERLHFMKDLEIRFLPESEPLGTGGALRRALAEVADIALALNGDSYCALDYAAFLRFHHAARAAVSLAATRVAAAGDYGTLELDADGYVTAFREKAENGPGWINAGAYVMERRFVEGAIPKGPASLERDVLPEWSARREVRAFRFDGFFRDIGTPERLAQARREFPPRDLVEE